MTGDWCVFKFFRCSVDGCIFRAKPPFSNSSVGAQVSNKNTLKIHDERLFLSIWPGLTHLKSNARAVKDF